MLDHAGALCLWTEVLEIAQIAVGASLQHSNCTGAHYLCLVSLPYFFIFQKIESSAAQDLKMHMTLVGKNSFFGSAQKELLLHGFVALTSCTRVVT